RRGVLRSVIHHDDFAVHSFGQGRFQHSAKQRPNVFFFVVEGDQDRDGVGCHGGAESLLYSRVPCPPTETTINSRADWLCARCASPTLPNRAGAAVRIAFATN